MKDIDNTQGHGHLGMARPVSPDDVESLGEESGTTMRADIEEKQFGVFHRLTRTLWKWGIETHGITPTSPQSRTDIRIHQFFWLWFSANFNILAFSIGSAGPAFFGLDLKSSLLALLFADLITFTVPAYFAVFGPKLGTRAMVQCRFSWGLYGAMIPSALNVFSSQGILIINSIIGGQALAAASHNLGDTLGIVIIGVISLVVTFCGYRALHWFERFAWIPNAIAFPILIGLASKHLNPTTFPPVATPTPAMVISYSSFVASSAISWCTFTPDYGVYHDHQALTLRIFLYTYFGFLLPSIAWHILGATLAAAAPGVPAWQAGFEGGNSIGGLLSAILQPTGTFGKVLLGIVALTTSCACAPIMYTFGTSFMAISNFARMPRYIFSIVSFAVLLPLSIIGAKKFYTVLVDILSVIGYWCTPFAAIVLTEHFVFRESSFSAYNTAHWDQAKLLLPGIAAILTFLGAFGVSISSMSQTWYTGPIATRAGSGDIGMYTGGVVAVSLYILLRTLERKMWPGR